MVFLSHSFLILILNFINFMPIVSNIFNVRKMRCCTDTATHKSFIQKFHKLTSFTTYKKYMILKNLCFIQSCNFNLTDFLKLRSFYHDLAYLKEVQYKKKLVDEISLNFPELLFNIGK